MKKISFSFFIVVWVIFSSWSLPLGNISTWKINLSGKDIISHEKNKPGEAVQISRSLLTENAILSVYMTFSGSESGGAESMVIITNENGKTIAGNPTKGNKGNINFTANISGKELLSKPEFAKAEQLNIMFDIKNAQTDSLNQLYVLGIIKLI